MNQFIHLVFNRSIFFSKFYIYQHEYFLDPQFNQMATEIHGILYSNVHRVSGDIYRTETHGEESFLRNVISPIYQVLRKVNY